MYKVFDSNDKYSKNLNRTTNARLLQKRIRLVHPNYQQHINKTRTPQFRWTDDADENIDIPDFLLKEPQTAKESKKKTRKVGLGIIFAGTFLLSFCGVFLFSHYLPTDATQFLGEFRPQPTPTTVLADTGSEQTASENLETAPEQTAAVTASKAPGTISATPLMPTMLKIKQGQYQIPTTRPDQKNGQLQPVTLDTFLIATTEVTRGQWKACADGGACSIDGFPNQYFDQNKLSLPITSVTTEQMMMFIDWINTKRAPGEPPFRLPLEAEWVVAARGGSDDHSNFAWGQDFDAAKIRSSDMLIPVDYREPVNGLFGMSDNAAERVSGCWIMEQADGRCYRNLGIVRGPVPGKINGQSANLSHRASRALNIRYENIGFRLAQ
ncbi:formylglycine-generating enzyme family protein [Hoeflea sp. TYP-13]|uniref:formylglycine-generating enzyme family protein n=1 Tax=Hoeflea sp. TYP-13 TaxID=3230023 RepID=UPI0034C65D12